MSVGDMSLNNGDVRVLHVKAMFNDDVDKAATTVTIPGRKRSAREPPANVEPSMFQRQGNFLLRNAVSEPNTNSGVVMNGSLRVDIVAKLWTVSNKGMGQRFLVAIKEHVIHSLG